MAKAHGKTARIYAGGYDLSGSTASVDVSAATDMADATTFTTAPGVQSTAKSYLPGDQSAKLTQKCFFDDAAGAIHLMLVAVRDLATTVATFYPDGDTPQGSQGYGTASAEILDGWKTSSPGSGATVVQADWTIGGDLEDVVALVPRASFFQVNGTLGAVLDSGAASAAGASAYFHILAIDPATTISGYKVQHSVDSTTWVDLLTTTLPGTAIGASRSATAATATINRYIRVAVVITASKNATLAVAFHRG